MFTLLSSNTTFWLRVLHFLNIIVIFGLLISGWAIYNVAPFYSAVIPETFTFGLYLTEALRWHFSLAWIFIASSTILCVFRVGMQSGGPALRPIRSKSLYLCLIRVFRFRLRHRNNTYHAIQRVMYTTVYVIFLILIVSGLSLWKPVQLQVITELLGGYEVCRRWHFWSMALLCSFIIVHIIMALSVPHTLLSMALGINLKK